MGTYATGSPKTHATGKVYPSSVPRQEGLLSRLVPPTGTKRLPRVSSSGAGVFVFFLKGGRFGGLGGFVGLI